MTDATHWNYNLAIGDGLDEGWPMEDPIAAARAYWKCGKRRGSTKSGT